MLVRRWVSRGFGVAALAVSILAGVAADSSAASNTSGRVTPIDELKCAEVKATKELCGIKRFVKHCPGKQEECDYKLERKFPGKKDKQGRSWGDPKSAVYWRDYCGRNAYGTLKLGSFEISGVYGAERVPEDDPKEPKFPKKTTIFEACKELNKASHEQEKKERKAHADKILDPKTDNFSDPKKTAAIDNYGASGKSTDTAHTWGSQQRKARLAALKAKIDKPATWQRPRTAKSDIGVGSCEDYVYNKYYDQERWLDAVYACKGDEQCIVKMSLKEQAPGIMHRRLMSKDNPPKKINSPFKNSGELDAEVLGLQGYIPKNDFYAGTGLLLTESLIAAFPADKQAELRKLAAALRSDLHAYKTQAGQGNGGGKALPGQPGIQGFSDEWDWHAVMYERTKKAMPGEFREYERRGAGMSRLLENTLIGVTCGNDTRCQLAQRVAYVDAEPEQRAGSPLLTRLALGHSAPRGDKPAPAKPALGSSDTDLPRASSAGTLNPLVAAITKDVVNDPMPYLEEKWKQFPPRVDVKSKYPRLDCGTPSDAERKTETSTPKVMGATARPPVPQATLKERFNGEQAACEATNRLLTEWNRKQKGKPSCLDKSNYLCDWSPELFTDHFVNTFETVQSQEKDEAYQKCRYWAPFVFRDGKACRPNQATCGDVNAFSVSDLETAMKDWRRHVEKELKNVPVLDADRLGSHKTDQGSIGNSAFGAQFSYDLLWNTVVHRDKSCFCDGAAVSCSSKACKNGKKPETSSSPCNLGARANAQFYASAYAFDSAPYNMIDAAVDVDANDRFAEQGHFSSHIDLLEVYELFDPPISEKMELNKLVSPPAKSDFTGFNVALIPAQVGWFTIIAKVDLGLLYGASMTVLTNKPACPAKPKLALEVEMAPSVGVSVSADVSVSVGGVAGLGVDTRVTLANLMLPLDAKLELKRTGKNKDELTIDAGLDLALSTLDGSVAAYAEVFGVELFYVELVNWDGPYYQWKLFDIDAPPVDVSVFSRPLPVPPSGSRG